MAGRDDDVREAAHRHGLSEAAVGVLWDALARGGGRQAQFSHPDLGGMGQWSGGGMVQIGDMFNNDLKAKVAAVCEDLGPKAAGGGPGSSQTQNRVGADNDNGGHAQHRDWWPETLGRPSSSGSQNAMRYAYFPQPQRLAIEQNGRVKIYDTGHHKISGVSQQQSQGSEVAFTSQDGIVNLESLKVVDG